MWTAIWARSSARARAWRSARRSRTRLSHHGPKTTTMAATTNSEPATGRKAAPVGWPRIRASRPARPRAAPMVTRRASDHRP